MLSTCLPHLPPFLSPGGLLGSPLREWLYFRPNSSVHRRQRHHSAEKHWNLNLRSALKPEHYYRQVREEVLPHLPAGPFRVLEVGCGAGGTLALIRERNPGAWVAGAELMQIDSPVYATLDH